MTNSLAADDAKVPTVDRWREIEPIIDAALELPRDQRAAYVRAACAGDAPLLAEVEQLLAAHDSPCATLDTPAAQRFASLLDDPNPALPEVLGGRYKIGSMLGRGGMATVYLADDLRHERQVAVKVLHAKLAAALGGELFLAEIKTTAQLHHPHILPLHDSGESDGLLYYVMPYVPGGTLRRRLREDRPLSVDEILRVTTEVASALDAAHRRGVIHRDIKPENILLHDGTALVADFGIALAVSAAAAARMAKPGLILGTPEYMSPEQATGDGAVDGRADVYSLGVVVYEMLTGRLPLAEPAPLESSSSKSRREIPATVDAALSRALAPAPADRQASAGELAAELRQALTPTTAKEPAARPPRQWRRIARAISIVIFVAGVAAALGYYAFGPNGPLAGLVAGTSNAAALDQYLLGQEQLRYRGPAIAKAIQSFDSAVDLDSNYARAHAGLATALSFGPPFLDAPPLPLIDSSVAEARRALALDGVLAWLFKRSTASDAYVVFGKAHGYRGEWAASDSDLRHAIKLNGNNSAARQTLARHLILRSHAAEAIEQLERARQADQTSPLISIWLAYAFFLEGNRDSAIAETERTSQIDTTLSAAANLGALLNLALGRNDVARRFAATPVGPAMTNAPYVYAKLGDTVTADSLLREMDARIPRPWFADVARASVLLATGDSARALTALERSSRDSGALWVFYIPLGDPAFDLVRKSARFAELLRKAGVESVVVTNPRRGVP